MFVRGTLLSCSLMSPSASNSTVIGCWRNACYSNIIVVVLVFVLVLVPDLDIIVVLVLVTVLDLVDCSCW